MLKIAIVFIVMLLFNPQQAHAKKGVMGDILGYAIGKALGKAVGESTKSNHVQIDEITLKKMSEYINEQWPEMINEHTRGDLTIAGPGKKLTYFYTITAYSSSEVDPIWVSQNGVPDVIQKACSTNGTMFLLKNGVNLVYSYQTNDGGLHSEFEISPETCKSNKPLKLILPYDLSNDLTRKILTKYVGSEVDEVEIQRCTQKVEQILPNVLMKKDYAKLAIATKVKMIANSSKLNIINMILKSYSEIITSELAARIYDALYEPIISFKGLKKSNY